MNKWVLVSSLVCIALIGCNFSDKKGNSSSSPNIVRAQNQITPPQAEAFTLSWPGSDASTTVSVMRYLHGSDGKSVSTNAPITLPQLVPDTLTVTFKDSNITIQNASLAMGSNTYPLGVTHGTGSYSLAGFRSVFADDKEQDGILSLSWVSASAGSAGQLVYITNVEITTPPAQPSVQIQGRNAGSSAFFKLNTPNARLDLVEIFTITNQSSKPIDVELPTNLSGASLHRQETHRSLVNHENPPFCTHQDFQGTTEHDLPGNFYVFPKDFLPDTWTYLLNGTKATFRFDPGMAKDFYVYAQNDQFAAWMDGGIPVSHYTGDQALIGCDTECQDVESGDCLTDEKYTPDSVGEEDTPLSLLVPGAVQNMQVRFGLSPKDQDPEGRTVGVLPGSQVVF